jgi:hypothetical protein
MMITAVEPIVLRADRVETTRAEKHRMVSIRR